MRSGVVVAALAYTALAVALFRPTPFELAHTAPAFSGFANDALILVWAMDHVSRTLFTAPLHLFDAPIFHPARLTLAYSDHMIGQSLVGLPIWLATRNPLLEFNLLVLLSYVLGAAGTYAYARALGASAFAAGAAGLVFGFTPYRFHSPLWLQVLFTAFVPLSLLAWLRFVRTRTLGAWLLWVACWTAHGLMGMYLTLYFGVVMVALAVLACVAAPPPRDRRLVVGSLAAPVATGLLLVPTLLPYWWLRGTPGHVRTFGLDTQWDFFLPGPGTWSAHVLGTEMLGRFGPGLAVWALAAVGLIVARRGRPRGGLPASFVWLAHVVGLAVTLALVLVPIDVQQRLPGFDMIRATNRAFYLTLFFVAVLVAEGIDALAARARTPAVATAAAVAILALLVADMGKPPRARVVLPIASDMPESYRVLRDLPGDPVVYEHVVGPEPLGRAMYFQTFHRKRMPTGYAGFWNPATSYVVHRLYRFPAPESVKLMRRLDVGYVLQHFANAAAAEAAPDDVEAGVRVVARTGSDVVFRIEPRPMAEPPAVELPRDGWTIASPVGHTALRKLIDGDPATLWTVTVPRGKTPSLTIDLGAVREVVGVRCRTPLDRAAGVQWSRIRLSEDGAEFVLAPAGFEPDSLAALYDAPERVHVWDARFEPRRARFVELTNDDLAFWGGEWTIGEVDVLGPAD